MVLAVNSMSTCGLVHAALMKTGKMYVAESEEAEFMKRCREFALQCVLALAILPFCQALQFTLPCLVLFCSQCGIKECRCFLSISLLAKRSAPKASA